jgi:DNA-binding CsgD family transcriptional regulator
MRFRLTRTSDLATYRELLHPGLRLSDRTRAALVDLLAELLPNRPATMTIEDPTRAYPASIEGIGLSVFVTDAFVDEILEHPRPYLAETFFDRMVEGRSPVLSRSEERAANSSSGLNVLVVHFGRRDPDMAHERARRVLQAGSAAFYFAHAGYRVKTLVNEVFGGQEAQYMNAGGFQMIEAFRKPSRPELAGVLPEHWPYLFAMRREWIAPGAVNQLAFLFHPLTPQLGLSASEQSVLLRALLNESDQQVAEGAGITVDAVKKTWRRLYERMTLRAPHVLGTEAPGQAPGRSTEKRRHLLEYMRTHPEELRPFKARQF